MLVWINIALLILLVAVAITVIRVNNLFAAVMLFGIYSLLSALIFVVLDAVDVAFTEASVGAGIATILMLGSLALVKKHEALPSRLSLPALVICIITGAGLMFAVSDMPNFGDPSAPVHNHVAPRYIQQSPQEIGIPNMVTSVLASYRGYDTLGEVTVIFSAGITVLFLLGRKRRKKKES